MKMSNLGNKLIMSENIKRLMRKKGVNAAMVCSDLGFPVASFSDWCNAKSYPRIDKIEKMANYFGVKKSELVEKYDDGRYIDDEAAVFAEFLKTHPEYKGLFDASRKVKAEDLEKAVRMLGIFTEE